jgi:tetratricopeptide (TPR) repeat protein
MIWLRALAVCVLIGCASNPPPALHVRNVERSREALAEALRAHSPERTIGLCSQAVALDSLCASCYYVRAVAWARVHQNEEARKDLRRAIALDKSYGSMSPAAIESLAAGDTWRDLEMRSRQRSKAGALDDSSVRPEDFASRRTLTNASVIRRAGDDSTGGGAPDSSAGKNSATGAARADSLQVADTFEYIDSVGDSSRDYNRGVPGAGTKAPAAHGRNRYQDDSTRARKNADRQESPQKDPNEQQSRAERIRQRRNDSLQLCLRRVAQAPNDCEGHLCVAQYRYALHQFKRAEKSATKAYACNAQLADALIIRAKTRGATGKYRKALRDVNAAIQNEPRGADRYMIKAWIMHCLGRYQKELQSLRMALREGYRYPEYLHKKIRDLEKRLE